MGKINFNKDNGMFKTIGPLELYLSFEVFSNRCGELIWEIIERDENGEIIQ